TADLVACTHLINTGTATATGLQAVSDPGDQTGLRAHLMISKTPDGGTFKIGDKPSFTIVVKSDGAGAAENVTLTDLLPTFGSLKIGRASCRETGWSIAANGTDLKSNLGTLQSGDLRSVVVASSEM